MFFAILFSLEVLSRANMFFLRLNNPHRLNFFLIGLKPWPHPIKAYSWQYYMPSENPTIEHKTVSFFDALCKRLLLSLVVVHVEHLSEMVPYAWNGFRN